MKKRIAALVLALVLLVSLCCVNVSAAEVLKTSDEAVKILKAEEGFSKKPYWDYSQWTVGYGTACPEDKRAYYTEHGISEEEAEALLRNHIASFEGELYKFISKTGVELTQNQFDALLLFSYNCGSAWSYDVNGGLYNAVVKKATGNEVIDAFSRWCNAGGQIKTFLLRRRLCEANMYLNGVYSQTPPENYGYVLYDACGGVSKPNVQGYDTQLTAKPNPVPTYAGYQFEGWFTARTGGTKVTVLTAEHKNGRVYAHWVDAEGKDPSQDDGTGVKVTVTANDVNVRQGPGTNYPVIGGANTGEELIITETATGTGYTWGKFFGGWICLDYTTYDEATAPAPEQKPVQPAKRMGTVKVNDSLRIRSGPSTGYSVVGYLNNGARVEILEQKVAGSMIWGKISKGWISLDYVVLDPVKEEQTPPETEPPVTEPPETEPPETEPPETEPPVTEPPETEPPVTEPEPEVKPQSWTGTVRVNDVLRIRSGPGTSYSVVGYLYAKQKVTITEQKTSGSMTWGKISNGWVSMDYITLDSTSTDNPVQSQKVTGTVKVNEFLRVRSGPGTSYAIAGYLGPNEKVEITEQKTVGSTKWGRISKGWISLDYVVLDGQSGSAGPSAPQKVTKTVTADCLRIRSAAGTSNTVVGYLYYGAKVEITDTTTVNGVKWGKTSKGWISMDYVK